MASFRQRSIHSRADKIRTQIDSLLCYKTLAQARAFFVAASAFSCVVYSGYRPLLSIYIDCEPGFYTFLYRLVCTK